MKTSPAAKAASATRPASTAPRSRRADGDTGTGGVYERLKAEILNNDLPPGSHAAEPELAQRLGVSRTPIREALIRLQGEGLVELIPRRGARIQPISPEDMREIYQILTALEPEAAANLAAQMRDGEATDETIAPLKAATRDMEIALEAGELHDWAIADDRFHRTLLQINGNRRLEKVIGGLLDQAHRARMLTIWMRKPPVGSTADHREIQEAIAAGDPTRARTLFRAHRERAADELIALLERSRIDRV
jgi:DNA-binding GntR family transcriptional regulator